MSRMAKRRMKWEGGKPLPQVHLPQDEVANPTVNLALPILEF
jgi:hypothetical protein